MSPPIATLSPTMAIAAPSSASSSSSASPLLSSGANGSSSTTTKNNSDHHLLSTSSSSSTASSTTAMSITSSCLASYMMQHAADAFGVGASAADLYLNQTSMFVSSSPSATALNSLHHAEDFFNNQNEIMMTRHSSISRYIKTKTGHNNS